MKAVSRYAKIKAAKVVKGLTTVALADPLDFLDREAGNILPLDQVPRRARMSVKSIKAKEDCDEPEGRAISLTGEHSLNLPTRKVHLSEPVSRNRPMPRPRSAPGTARRRPGTSGTSC